MQMRSRYLGAFALSALAVALVATSAFAGGNNMRCRGGANAGETCETDADCPGACVHNAGDATCDASTPCPRVCKGGDTPGAECPDGTCPGHCVGGDNRTEPCTGSNEECPGGYCNTSCREDKCKMGNCRTGGGHSESRPIQVSADDSWDEDEADYTACVAVVE
jgi:hypothetical protein